MKKRILFILLAIILLFSTRSYGMSEADQTKESFMNDFGSDFKYTEIEGSSERSGNIDAKNHYYQIEENGEMVISEKGELIIYNTIDLHRPIFNETVTVNRAGKQKEEIIENSLNQWNEKEDFQELEHRLDKYIPDNFALQESRPVFEHEWELFYGVEREDGIVNPYHGIKILIDRTDGRLLSFYRYKGELPEGLDIIEEEVARHEAEQNIKDEHTLEFMELRVIDEDFLPDKEENHEPIAYGAEKALYLVYVYQSSDGEIYIDAINGETFSFNEYESYGTSFYDRQKTGTNSAGKFVKNHFRWERAKAIADTMKSLGIESGPVGVSSNGTYNKNSILGTLKRSSQRGFSFSGHASISNLLLTSKNQDGSQPYVRINYSEVPRSNKWQFVFLDGCNTNASNSNWPSAFGISSSSKNKVFLGWFQTVLTGTTKKYTAELSRQVRLKPRNRLYSNVVNAYNVEGMPYCPIKFTGDKTIINWK